MHHYKSVLLTLTLVIWGFNKPALALPLLCESRLVVESIPKNAYFLPENQASQLQHVLDKYTIVRLKPQGDYSRALTTTLRSNQGLFGLSGTKLPKIVFSKITTNAILSGVSPTSISFESGSISKMNCINRISNSLIEANNATLENNLFTDLSNVRISSDTSQQGYLKNNRFIRTMVHGQYPSIIITGNLSKKSAGNQFVWTNILTPGGDGIIIKNQKDISFIGLDAESWNWSKKAIYPGMMNVLNTDFLSVMMSNGGDNKNLTGQYFNLDASTVLLQGMNIGRTSSPGIKLGNNVKSLVTVNTQDIGLQNASNSNEVIDIFKDNKAALSINNKTTKSIGLLATSKAAIFNALQTEFLVHSNWEKPKFNAIPDPAGSKWEKNISGKPDSSATIQALIDKNGIAELSAGIYYLAKPLTLKNGQGIIGAGAEKTALIAKSADIDLIVGADHMDNITTVTTFTLADITLQGARNGINHNAQGSGQGAQYNRIVLSHVTFRNMKNAGILIDSIYTWDNNFIDNTNFYRCNTGIKQRPDPAYVGGEHMGSAFLDKNVFYQNQFIENDIALDWQAKRGNNLNAFINCLFKNNKLSINATNTDSTIIVNSTFIVASNQPLLQSNRVIGFINSNFINVQPGQVLFNGNVYCNHCSFDNSAINTGLIVSPTSQNSYFVNSTLSKAVNQSIGTGVILNSAFSDNVKKSVNTIFSNQIADPF
jgi:hypothetical protein